MGLSHRFLPKNLRVGGLGSEAQKKVPYIFRTHEIIRSVGQIIRMNGVLTTGALGSGKRSSRS